MRRTCDIAEERARLNRRHVSHGVEKYAYDNDIYFFMMRLYVSLAPCLRGVIGCTCERCMYYEFVACCVGEIEKERRRRRMLSEREYARCDALE